MDIATIIGYAATVSLLLGYLPQTIRTIRTCSTDDIAMGTFSMMGLGALLFAIQGTMTGNMPLLVANVCSTTMSAIIFGIKVYNDYFRRK